ncbi:retrovirus-related pol polyprotein from transposon TNT 1-94 [Tanacetum coccineum]|uniref:Retrovirus-related pol polyprotein from transposon TNT 1-94 n=1 Tax=Tanacetum coccineum TaxID=301880 RepID=A0ABQ5FLQ1_9ASTR
MILIHSYQLLNNSSTSTPNHTSTTPNSNSSVPNTNSPTHSTTNNSPTGPANTTSTESHTSTSPSPPPLRKSIKNKQPPIKLQDYILPTSKIHSVTYSKHHNAHYTNYSNLTPNSLHFINNIHKVTEPTTYLQASKNPKWVEAMNLEIQALEKNNTWKLVPLPAGKIPIGSKWVYRIKHKANGTIERYKARVVAKGFNQKEGIDYTETFAPVAKMVTVRTLIAMAISNGWIIEQLDVNNAFLHGDLHEDVYMKVPQGYSTSLPSNIVCKLTKSLYGLKQANRQWFEKLTTFLVSIGFKQSYVDTSLFTLDKDGKFVTLLVYVDDILLAGNDKKLIQGIKANLNEKFSIKDLGALHYYLGIEFFRNSEGLAMTQKKYATDLITHAGLLHTKPSAIPLDPILKLTMTGGTPLQDPLLYRTLVGKLIYLTITRHDLAFSAQALSQFLQIPTTLHMKALIKVLRYVKLTTSQGLFFPTNNNLHMTVFCDSDWASCPFSRRSFTGYGVFLGPSLISWQSKKQLVISRSSTEVEYRALADTTCEVTWLKCLLKEFQVFISTPIPIMCDNASSITLAFNPVHHARTKHIEIDCHFVRDKESEDVLALAHCVASCVYEENTNWGSQIGFRYGTLSKDIYTDFRIYCSGWKSVTCNPTRAAFLGGILIDFNGFICQSSRWYMGLLQMGLSKFSPVTFGMKFLNPLQGMCYAQYHFRVFWCIPIFIYAFFPQLELINSFPTFSKVSDPWFCLYAFLFLGAYGKDLYEFVKAGSMFQKWWNRQRMLLILGSSCFPLSIFNWLLASLSLSTFDFNVTSKMLDTELSKHYEKGFFEFGVDLPLLLPVNIAHSSIY